MRLVIRSDPQPTESFLGFLLRLATLNAQSGVVGILRRAQLTRRFDIPRPNLSHLSTFSEVSVQALGRLGYWREGPAQHAFGRHRIALGSLSGHYARVCPDCVSDAGWCPNLWDLRAYPACHRHGWELVHTCPACGLPLKWTRPAVHSCNCGFDLRESRPTPATPEALTVARNFARMQAGKRALGTPTRDIQTYSRLVGILGYPADCPLSMRGVQRTPLSASAETATRAAPLLNDWPRGLHRWLDGKISEHAHGTRLHDDFGRVLLPLRECLPSPAGDFVLESVRAYVATNWHGYTAGNCFFQLPEKMKYRPHMQVARELGISTSVLVAMVQSGELSGVIRARGKRRTILVEAAAVPHAREILATNLTLVQTAKRLGLTELLALQLRRAGFLQPYQMSKRTYYKEAEVRRFLEAINARCKSVATSEGMELLNSISSRHRSFSKIISRILAGELSVFRVDDQPDLSAFAVRRVEVYGTDVASTGSKCLSLRAAARTLHVAQRQIQLMQRDGLLPRRSDHYRYPVTEEAIEVFQRDFIRSHDVARILKVGFRSARAGIAGVGIKPIVETDSSQGISATWSRDEVLCSLNEIRAYIVSHPLEVRVRPPRLGKRRSQLDADIRF